MTLQSIHRSSRARRWFGLLVGLLSGLKALTPAGYMLAAVDGHAQWVMCPAGVYHRGNMHHAAGMLPMAGMNHSLGLDHAPAIDHAAHASLAARQCPFALASGAALVAMAREVVEPYFVLLRPVRADAVVSVPIAPPLRYHAPRGPPALA